MTTEGAQPRTGIDLTAARRIAIFAATWCVLLVAMPIFAQQDSSDAASNRQYGGVVVSQNPDADAQPSDSSQDPAQSRLPNAPSATVPTYKPVGELTLGDRFTIYRKAVVRPYSLVGPAFGAGIGQWEDEPPEWGQGAKGYGRRIASGMQPAIDLRNDSIWLCGG